MNNNNHPSNNRRVIRALTKDEDAFVRKMAPLGSGLGDSMVADAMVEAGLGLDYSRKELRNKIRFVRKKMEKEAEKKNGATEGVRVRINETPKGNLLISTTETGEQAIPDEEFFNEELLKQSGLDPNKYILSGLRTSTWQSEDGDERQSIRRSFSLQKINQVDAVAIQENLLRKVTAEYEGGQVSKYFADELGQYNKIPRSCKKRNAVILAMPDLHIGEADAEKMAASYMVSCRDKIFPYIRERYFSGGQNRVETIDLALLGDIVHCDTATGTTTKGTMLFPKSTVEGSSVAAFNFLSWLISSLREEFKTPIRVIYVRGNHDVTHGWHVVFSLKALFGGTEGITFIEPVKDGRPDWVKTERSMVNPDRAFVGYGPVGVTFVHDPGKRKNIANNVDLANPNARRDYDVNALIYAHLHHIDTAETACFYYGVTTPNFAHDEYAREGAFVTRADFTVFDVDYNNARLSYTLFPSNPID